MQDSRGVQPLAPWGYAALCLGFGCFFAVCPFSALGTQAMILCALGWQEVLFGRVVFLAVSAACYAAWANHNPQSRPLRGPLSEPLRTVMGSALAGGAFTVAGFAVLPLANALSTFAAAAAHGSLLGLAMATLGNGWFRLLFVARTTHGRTACIASFAASFLLTVLISWLFGPVQSGWLASLASVTCLAGVSCACFVLLAKKSQPAWWVDEPSEVQFRPTTYAWALLMSLGVTWALAYNITVEVGYGSGPGGTLRWALSLVSCGALLVLVLALARRLNIGTVRFGLLMRWVIAAIGSLWAFTPILAMTAPIAVNVIYVMVFWMQLIVFFIFAMEVSLERHLPFQTVLARYFVAFVLAACVGSLAFWLIRTLVTDPWAMHSLVAALAVVASLAVMPLMPSRGSSANAFTLEHLPEDEGAAARNERTRQEFAQTCGFTPREAEVFELLMAGRTREEIAAELTISPWTAKNHTRAVFSKTKTHSAKELMALVYGERD